MNASKSPRPETLALDALIQETVAQVQQSAGNKPVDTMLFLGNRHQSFPTLVITDPVLEPVDKLVWMVVMLQVHETAASTVFPGYGSIGQMANVGSRSTVARAIAILRVTRWLTLCARVRATSGRFCGNLYALHDEPLPLVDAFHLDTGYMTFLDSATVHGHARVRAVARGMLDSMDADVCAGHAVGAREHPVNRRLENLPAFEQKKPRRFFDFTQEVVAELKGVSGIDHESPVDHDQNLNMDRVRNSNSGSCSSYIYKTTTTTQEASKFDIAGEEGLALIYPKRLLGDQLDVANRYLTTLDPSDRQPVLDELEGRFHAEAQGMTPLYDELRFLHALCRAVKSGSFEANLGIKVRSQRLKREQQARAQVHKDTEAPQECDETDERSRKLARKNMAKMREVLGSQGRAQTPGEEV